MRNDIAVSPESDANLDNESVHHSAPELSSCASRSSEKRYSSSHLKPGLGQSRCKCGKCGEAFNSLKAFDKHQRLVDGVLICTHPLDIVNAKGRHTPLSVNAAGWWITEPSSREFTNDEGGIQSSPDDVSSDQ